MRAAQAVDHTRRRESSGEGLSVPFDFWKCQKCGRICTKLEMLAATGLEPDDTCCPCGSLKYSPMNLPWWGWVLPRVWRLAGYRVLGWA